MQAWTPRAGVFLWRYFTLIEFCWEIAVAGIPGIPAAENNGCWLGGDYPLILPFVAVVCTTSGVKIGSWSWRTDEHPDFPPPSVLVWHST